MKYSSSEVLQYIEEEDVKFIRLAFCDIHGNPKNISIMPRELEKAFATGISIEGKAIDSSIPLTAKYFLIPDSSTLSLLPWRPDHGRVVRMYCKITDENGADIESDFRTKLRYKLKDIPESDTLTQADFTLLITDENGAHTGVPYDDAGYLDIAPKDKCENIRRSICLTLESMGITPVSSCHSHNPGQNRINYSSPNVLSSADNMATFVTVVRTVAAANGLFADDIRFRVDAKDKQIHVTTGTNPYEVHQKLI